jgi:hypothetical protein
LLILFSVIKSVLGGSKANVTDLNEVLQSQQELIHLTANTSEEQTPVSAADQNFAVTVQLALGSEQSQLKTYMKANHEKVNTKELNAKVSATVDTEIATAVSAGTYDATFKQVMQSELTDYLQTLKAAYTVTTGAKGRSQLTADYNGAQLLQQQLTSSQS